MRELPVGTWVRVGAHHRIRQLRGTIGKVVGRYGGDAYVAVEVRLVDGRYRLFWPPGFEGDFLPAALVEVLARQG
jgi:hypothetical protein